MLLRIFVIYIALCMPVVYAAGDFFSEADELYENNQYIEVENKSKNELKINANSLDAYFFLIAVRLKQGKFQEAIPYMENFASIHNKIEEKQSQSIGHPYILIDARYTALYYQLGQYYFENKKYADANKWFMRAKSSYYNDPMFNFFIGISYKEVGEYADAIKHFQRQLEINPEEPSPFYNIACTLAVQGNIAESIKWLSRAIEANPKYKEEARKDHDFDSIRNTVSFRKLIND